MNKKLIAIGIMLVFLIVGLNGCIEENSDDKVDEVDYNKFIGTWVPTSNNTSSFTLFSNGTGWYFNNTSIDWGLEDGYFYLIFLKKGVIYCEYTFSENNSKLRVKNLPNFTIFENTYIKN